MSWTDDIYKVGNTPEKWTKATLDIGEKYAWEKGNKRLVIEEMGNKEYYILLKESKLSHINDVIPITGGNIRIVRVLPNKKEALKFANQYMRQ